MTDALPKLGFVGLGQMGGPMAANIAKGGFGLLCYDKAGSEALTPDGGEAAPSLAHVCANVDTLFLSLPDGPIVEAVTQEIASADVRRLSLVIDLSTVGPASARQAAETLKAAGVGYIDAPVSGGRAGALAGTITLIWAGPRSELDRHRPIVDAFCGNPFHVGDEPGQGQAMKLLNNFLSATALAATSEAVLFGLENGLDMQTICDVVNVSTGQNTASRDKFPQRIVTGTYDAGFTAALLNKDVGLYRDNVAKTGTASEIGACVSDIWDRCANSYPPGTDITRIFDFLRDGGPGK